MLSRRRQYIRLLLMLLFAKAKIWDSFRFYLFFADASFKYISSKCCKKTGCVCSFFLTLLLCLVLLTRRNCYLTLNTWRLEQPMGKVTKCLQSKKPNE